MARKRKRKWIRKAVKKPGSLRETVQRRYGKKGFTKKGTIKVETLQKMSKEGTPKTSRRARLALTLRKLRK